MANRKRVSCPARRRQPSRLSQGPARHAVHVGNGRDPEALDPGRDPDTGNREERNDRKRGEPRGPRGPDPQFAIDPHPQVAGAVHHDQRNAQHAGDERERVEQLPEGTRVERAQIVVEVERDTLQQIAERDAEDQRRHEAADEQAPVPGPAPTGIVNLVAILEPHGTEEQREQHEQHCDVHAGKCRRVDERPRGEHDAAGDDQPRLVAFPVGLDRAQDDAPLVVGVSEQRRQDADAEVPAVGQREHDDDRSDEAPPDHLQRYIVEDHRAPLNRPRTARGCRRESARRARRSSGRCRVPPGRGGCTSA